MTENKLHQIRQTWPRPLQINVFRDMFWVHTGTTGDTILRRCPDRLVRRSRFILVTRHIALDEAGHPKLDDGNKPGLH